MKTGQRDVKIDTGDRVVPLGPTTVAALTEYLARRTRWQEISGDDWPNTGMFFLRPNGRPWHPQTISDRFDHLVATGGLPPLRLHGLRHCAATYLRHGGADLEEIQQVLGHSNIAITSDTYTSVPLEFQCAPNADTADLIPPRQTGRGNRTGAPRSLTTAPRREGISIDGTHPLAWSS